MAATTFSAMLRGPRAEIVRVETQLARGLPYFVFVGLADTAVREARDRVKISIQNSGFDFPRFRKVVNLAPSNIRKKGTQFDLSIAVGLLAASKQIVARDLLESSVFVGELNLDGTIRGTSGTLAMVEAARDAGFKRVFIGDNRMPEANLVKGIRIFAPRNLKELTMHLKGERTLGEASNLILKASTYEQGSNVKGHEIVKRALQIACLFRHHIVLVGPPGMGKSLLARSVTSLLPKLNKTEMLDVVRLYSSFTDTDFGGEVFRPFREVSHTVSVSALTGGGVTLTAGEMSLAHKGVLMLDDLHNFSRAHIEALLKPMEEKEVFVSSGRKKIVMPADFMLIATMNPCPCGKRSILNQGECECREFALKRFAGKFPAAFWDRVDMVLEVPNLREEDVVEQEGEGVMRGGRKALERQHRRLIKSTVSFNGEMSVSDVGHLCKMHLRAEDLLKRAIKTKMVSGRGYFNAIKVAQSIADLEGHEKIEPQDIAEALSYRARLRT